MRSTRFFTTLAFSLACSYACKPTLMDGRYGCASGQCPSGWFCHADKLCYRAPEVHALPAMGGAGIGMAPSNTGGGGTAAPSRNASGGSSGSAGSSNVMTSAPDAGQIMEPPYAACTASTPCRMGQCNFGPDETASQGVCSMPCGQDAECPPSGASGGVCLAGKCLPGCSGPGQCAAGTHCFAALQAMRDLKQVCYSVASSTLDGTAVCTPQDAMTTCPPPAGCALSSADPHGVCSLACNASTECPQGQACIAVQPPMITQCFKTCMPGGPMVCGPNLICGHLAGLQNVCIPAGWANRMVPLPPP